MTVWRGRRPARLAILPFRAMQDVPEAVGHGVAEAVMLRLARERHPAIEVLAWDSVANMASLGLFARDVGAALHADVVLAGSVSALPCHFRVRAEMIQVSDHVQLWLEDFLISCDTEGLEEQVAERIGFRTQSMKPIRKCMDAAEIEASEDPAA